MPYSDLAGSARGVHHWLMEYLLLAVAGGVGLAWLGVRLRARRARGRQRVADLAEMRKLCDEDVALLGEDLRRLDAETAAHPLDDAARDDYQATRDAQEAAQRTVGWVKDADEISRVTETLASGRYALACVQARVEGRPVPKPRVPCFFNPQHGPSVFEVPFTPAGHGTRKVPACASDVARFRAKEPPEIREVEVGGRRVPYFAAGDAFAPYGEGYFTGDSAIQKLFVTSTSWSGEGRSGRRFDSHGVSSDGMFG
jgi:hypothetical protein